MSRNGFTIWWVRTSPRVTISSLRSPFSSSFRKRTLPEVGCTAPTRQEKSVVFPAPFGPMTLKISFGCTSKDTESRARSPPKRLLTDETARMGPLSAGTVRLRHRLGSPPWQLRPDPLQEPHDASRLEEHHHDQQPSVDEEVRVAKRGARQQLDLQVAEEHRPEHGTGERSHPADDRHQDDRERQPEVEH